MTIHFFVQRLVLLSLLLIPARSAVAITDWIDYDHGLLSVEFSEIALKKALQLTQDHTGIEFAVDPGIDSIINIQFDRQPLTGAIRQLLDGYNYMIIYHQGDARDQYPKRVQVISKISHQRQLATGVITAPQTTVTTAPSVAEIVLHRTGPGHYMTTGTINNKPVEFLLDTGATTMALSGELANHIDLGYGAAKQIETANGRTTGFETNLYSVSLGSLTLRNVRAIILPGMNLGRRVLLGMNVLESFNLIKEGDRLILRERK